MENLDAKIAALATAASSINEQILNLRDTYDSFAEIPPEVLHSMNEAYSKIHDKMIELAVYKK